MLSKEIRVCVCVCGWGGGGRKMILSNYIKLEKARYALPPLYMESHEEELHQLAFNSYK